MPRQKMVCRRHLRNWFRRFCRLPHCTPVMVVAVGKGSGWPQTLLAAQTTRNRVGVAASHSMVLHNVRLYLLPVSGL